MIPTEYFAGQLHFEIHLPNEPKWIIQTSALRTERLIMNMHRERRAIAKCTVMNSGNKFDYIQQYLRRESHSPIRDETIHFY